MPRSKTAALIVATLLCVTGVAAATGGVGAAVDASAQADETTSTPSNVDATALVDNGTLEVTVTADGSPAENVSVIYDDQTQLTDENGTVSFNVSEDDEVELELEKGGFEGELAYALEDGSLTLVEEEYEYEGSEEHAEESEDDEAEEDEEESEEAEDADEDDENDEEDADEEESEDDKAEEDDEDEDEDDD
ncbi:MAG: hypothetical protein ABEH78_09815 [Haloferacaceae archaeon]